MPTNNFKLFDENRTNILTNAEYASNQQRINGVQSGIASSKLQNKSMYQNSLMSYALAQLMYQNGIDADDEAQVSTFISNLDATLLQKVLDKASYQDVIDGTLNKWVDAKNVHDYVYNKTESNKYIFGSKVVFNGLVDSGEFDNKIPLDITDEDLFTVREIMLELSLVESSATSFGTYGGGFSIGTNSSNQFNPFLTFSGSLTTYFGITFKSIFSKFRTSVENYQNTIYFWLYGRRSGTDSQYSYIAGNTLRMCPFMYYNSYDNPSANPLSFASYPINLKVTFLY